MKGQLASKKKKKGKSPHVNGSGFGRIITKSQFLEEIEKQEVEQQEAELAKPAREKDCHSCAEVNRGRGGWGDGLLPSPREGSVIQVISTLLCCGSAGEMNCGERVSRVL